MSRAWSIHHHSQVSLPIHSSLSRRCQGRTTNYALTTPIPINTQGILGCIVSELTIRKTPTNKTRDKVQAHTPETISSSRLATLSSSLRISSDPLRLKDRINHSINTPYLCRTRHIPKRLPANSPIQTAFEAYLLGKELETGTCSHISTVINT